MGNQNVALLDRIRDQLVIPCAARCPMTEARFLDVGMGALGADARDEVLAAVASEHGSLIVNIRADIGVATCYLVARGDKAKPILLFALKATDEAPN